jgi:hypothetical protein
MRNKCERPDCDNEVPPHRDRFCSDACLKTYSKMETARPRLLRTLRGYGYTSRRDRARRLAS